MNTLFRVLAIESIRALALLFVSAASFALTGFAVSAFNAPFTLFGQNLFAAEWQFFLVVSLICFGPAWFAGHVPGFAETRMDHDMGARSPSKREAALFDLIETHLKQAADKAGMKLPVIVWKVRDSGEINAFAFGRNRVAFTKGLLRKYVNDPKGLEYLSAIAAHEIGHLKN